MRRAAIFQHFQQADPPPVARIFQAAVFQLHERIGEVLFRRHPERRFPRLRLAGHQDAQIRPGAGR